MQGQLKFFLFLSFVCLLLVGLLNDLLAPYSVYLYIAGFFPVLAALYLPFMGGLVAIMILGLWVDASHMYVPYSLTVLTYLCIFFMVVLFRHRVAKEDPYDAFLSLIANGLSFLVLTVTMKLKGGVPLSLRLGIDFLASQAFLWFLSRYFVACLLAFPRDDRPPLANFCSRRE